MAKSKARVKTKGRPAPKEVHRLARQTAAAARDIASATRFLIDSTIASVLSDAVMVDVGGRLLVTGLMTAHRRDPQSARFMLEETLRALTKYARQMNLTLRCGLV